MVFIKRFLIIFSILYVCILAIIINYNYENNKINDETIDENLELSKAGITSFLDTVGIVTIQNYYQEQLTEEDNEVIWNIGYTIDYVNVRKSPSLDSEIYTTYQYNTEINYTEENEEWVKIKFNESVAYIDAQFVSVNKIEYTEVVMPNNIGFKSYMDYRTITDDTSMQYKLQTNAITGEYGIRKVDGRCCVALGTYFNISVGTYFDLVLENGSVIPCIVADIKRDVDTLSNNITTTKNGCVSEFIVDINYLNDYVRIRGNMSYCNENWDSSVEIIKIYDKNYFG